uniref:Uncharacterized protein n=1 Tax=Geospiza parvula TaxID=87175 RepID=A0A8C3MMX4_GEOPR
TRARGRDRPAPPEHGAARGPEVAAGSAASAVMLPERLQRREAERQQGVERQRQKKEAQVVKEEQSEFFLAAFAREREAVEALLAAGTLEEAAARLQALQKLLTGSVRFLAPYEVRQGQETVARLQGDLTARRHLNEKGVPINIQCSPNILITRNSETYGVCINTEASESVNAV